MTGGSVDCKGAQFTSLIDLRQEWVLLRTAAVSVFALAC